MKEKIYKIIMTTHCPHCDYDEATGTVFNHCDACCRKIVREISRVVTTRELGYQKPPPDCQIPSIDW